MDAMDISSRSRSPHRSVSAQTHCWVKVRNGKSAIRISFKEIAEPRDVANLIEFVKATKNSLITVDLDDLQLFQSGGAMNEGKDALRPGLEVSAITGGKGDDSPLFLWFPCMEAPPSQALRGE